MDFRGLCVRWAYLQQGGFCTVHVTYFRKNLNIKIREHAIYKTEIVSSLLIQNPGPFVPASFSCSVFKTY